MQCTESLVSLKISVTFSIGAPLTGECVCCCQLSYDLLCTGYFYLSYLTRRILNCWLISPRLPWTLWCICSARWPGAASLCRWALWAPRTGLTSLRASGRSWLCCEPARWRSVLLCGPSCPHRSAAGRRGFLSGGKKEKMKLYHVNWQLWRRSKQICKITASLEYVVCFLCSSHQRCSPQRNALPAAGGSETADVSVSCSVWPGCT